MGGKVLWAMFTNSSGHPAYHKLLYLEFILNVIVGHGSDVGADDHLLVVEVVVGDGYLGSSNSNLM
jgi:hypothetical protein